MDQALFAVPPLTPGYDAGSIPHYGLTHLAYVTPHTVSNFLSPILPPPHCLSFKLPQENRLYKNRQGFLSGLLVFTFSGCVESILRFTLAK